MNILVTGSDGFLGRNLVVALERAGRHRVWAYDLGSPPEVLAEGLAQAEIVFHLAGVNRPKSDEEFHERNTAFSRRICSVMRLSGRTPAVVVSSSVQAALDNPYGVSKRLAEEAFEDLSSQAGVPVVVYRFPGIFGKWSRPNYNSVVATFCHNVVRGLPIQVTDPNRSVELVYVDDVVGAFLGLLDRVDGVRGFARAAISPSFDVELRRLADLIRSFKEHRQSGILPELGDPFVRRLYSTYLSFLPADDLAYAPKVRADARGSLVELIKAGDPGQVFISRTLPGVTRGHHYHDSKVEKFVVLEGSAVVRLRNMATGERVEYPVTGRDTRVIDIPPGWTHAIENTGSTEIIVLFWASEVFDAARPDTYSAEV